MGKKLTDLNRTRYVTLGFVLFSYLAGYMAWGDLGERWQAAALVGTAVIILEEGHRRRIKALEADVDALRAQLAAAVLSTDQAQG
ncbi:MAG TPA: hypothetical protein VN229_09355 [Terriglobales bacterium]|nr:hypothetical protein [Terriglobales bacterium]